MGQRQRVVVRLAIDRQDGRMVAERSVQPICPVEKLVLFEIQDFDVSSLRRVGVIERDFSLVCPVVRIEEPKCSRSALQFFRCDLHPFFAQSRFDVDRDSLDNRSIRIVDPRRVKLFGHRRRRELHFEVVEMQALVVSSERSIEEARVSKRVVGKFRQS